MFSFGVFTTGNFVNLTLANASALDGDGPVVVGAVRRRLGRSPVQAFLAARYSKLSGESDSMARVAGSIADAPDPPLIGAATVTHNGP